MNYSRIYETIAEQIGQRRFDTQLYKDAFSCLRHIGEETPELSYEMNHWLMSQLESGIRAAVDEKQYGFVKDAHELYYRTLLYTAPHFFDDFLRAIEFNRQPEKKFYMPRRHYLKPMVQGYQDVLDGKLHLLTVSQPKRTGKSQTEILFTLMLSGKYPERSSLMEGTGDDLVRSFYNGCLEYLTDTEKYSFYDIFPNVRLAQTNADTKIINLNVKSRFPTIMCRSIDSRQVGLSEASSVLTLDDCVEGREEAKNRQRLDDKWEIIRGDVMGRALEGTPIVATGTRYSLYDPIGRLQEEAVRLGWAWRAVEIPALDPVTDESNYEFECDGKRYFTTQFFREQREFLSEEQWESEFQQQPFEAKGLMFPKDTLNYYFDLPTDKDPDAVIAVCDTAESGADSCSLPIAYIYGEDVFIEDVVFDNSSSDVTKPQCAKKLVEHKVSTATFESNNAGEYFARDVDTMIKTLGGTTSVRKKRTISNKQTRIEFASDGIKKHFFFKDPSKYERNSQYAQFMRELTTHVRSGKVKHDDAADSLSLLENEIRKLAKNTVEVFRRPY